MVQKHYSIDDKLKLIALIKQHSKVVKNKKTDGVGSLEKDEAWLVITEEFNAKVTFKKATTSLYNCWQHIKQRARKNAAQLKQQTCATGGSVNTAKMNAVDAAALEILHPFSVEGLQNISNCDAENEYPNKAVFNHLLETKEIQKWKKWDPQKMKNSLSAPLRDAIVNASQPTPGTSTTSRQIKSATNLIPLKIKAFQLIKKSLIENQALEKEYLKTKMERERLELEILKAKHSGLYKRKKSYSINDKLKEKVFCYDKKQKTDCDNNVIQQTDSKNDDESIFLSSDSDEEMNPYIYIEEKYKLNNVF